jgi:glycerophosphoryl diester phosphodiesterase
VPATGPAHPELVTVAHRAGNDPARSAAAIAAGVDRVEADVHLFRGVLEVRHARTVGPVPVVWDRWELHGPGWPRLTLEAVLDVVGGALYVDLKGRDPRLGPAVVAAVRHRRAGDVVLSSRRWAHLEALRGTPGVQLVPTVGRGAELRRLLERTPRGSFDGVAVHERLLDEVTTAHLLERARVVYGWPVNDPAIARRLLACGVTGLISDEVDLLADLAARRSTDH